MSGCIANLACQSARRSVAMLVLLGFVAGTTGMPIPRLARSRKDRSQPFPCQDHSCGCASAAQCWQSCCCYTNHEKLAWAEKRGVTPPHFVILAAAREASRKKAAACCAVGHPKSCCDHSSTCCDLSQRVEHEDEEHAASSSVVVEFVLAVHARRCQGQPPLWLALGAIAPPPATVELHCDLPCCGDVAAMIAAISGVSSSPATPPPRA